MVTMPKTYPDAVRVLAHANCSSDSTIQAIWSVPDPNQAVVRLIEISDADLPEENGMVAAVQFGKSRDYPFDSEIALVTPDDWSRIESGSLKLPPGWDFNTKQNVA